MRTHHYYRYLGGALIAGAVLLLALQLIPHRTLTEAQIRDGAYWTTRIHAAGGEQAYAELADALSDKDPNFSHQAAHTFGGALYRAEGLSGISVCDTRFIYGCFHQFTAEAITDKGLGAIGSLGTLCADNLQCLHGIGHGIVAYLGYDQSSLQKAAADCLQLPKHDLFSGCTGGVFMEYALRSMLGDAAPRLLKDGEDERAPCDTLGDADAAICYYWQPQTWKLSWQAGTTTPFLFARMGALCQGAGAQNRLFCFAGIGAAAVSATQYDPARLAALCDSTSGELTDQALCRAAGGKALAGAVSPSIGARACTGLPDATQRACLRYISTPATPADFAL